MEKIKITNLMLIKARQKSIELGKLKNSILNGNGNFAGFLGEFIVAKKLTNGRIRNTYNYDIELNSGLTVDVKTKQTTVNPLPNYDCSVAKYNTKQTCDIYCFTRILKDYSCGWILG